MKKSINLLQNEFISSSTKTEQYLSFHRTFKSELKKLLKPYCKDILINKPNHFDVNGFFKLNNDKIFYFSIGDLRFDKKSMLIRTAEHFKDWSGGSNGFISLNEDFSHNLLKYIEVV